MNVKGLFAETLKDNRKLIVGLYALFIIAFIISWIIIAPEMQTVAGNVPRLSGPGNSTSAVELFIHNEGSGILTYLASVLFGIAAVVMVVYNAVSMAMVGQLFANIMPNGGIMYILYLIPHGIFEITGMILQSAAGVLLFLFIWRFIKAFRGNGASAGFEMTKKTLVQSIVLMVIATILLAIAAPIESYVSAPLAESVMGMLGLM